MDIDDDAITFGWYAFMRSSGGLSQLGERLGQDPDEPPTDFDPEFEVMAVWAHTNPLDPDTGRLKSGVTVAINPHRSPDPFTYTT